MDRDSMIEFYFRLGMSYKDILRSLALQGTVITERHLNRILRARLLYRRRYDLDAGIDFIVEQLQGPGKDHGYRWMYTKCKQHGIPVRKEDVRILLSLLDPVGSLVRRTRRLRRRQYFAEGPNFVWHVDSYDKLKPYGICINGCIDGFSRNIIWLRAALTNSDPTVIGGYFVEAVERCGGSPRLVRTDMGTENVVVRDIQRYLRRNDVDDRVAERSYITGPSTANQRIESWWGVMRKEGIESWITLLAELKDEGFFAGDFIDKALSQFCFMPIIQLPSSRFRFVSWHRLEQCDVTGDQLTCPRVREGPSQEELYRREVGDLCLERGRRRRGEEGQRWEERRQENWENCLELNLSYQNLGDPFQQENFLRILRRLIRVEKLLLIDNSLSNLSSVRLPRCRMLNLHRNHLVCLRQLPKLPAVEHLCLSENAIRSLGGLGALEGSPLRSLNLTRNPVTFTQNYRARVFSCLPKLEILDEIPKLPEDSLPLRSQFPETTRMCNIL